MKRYSRKELENLYEKKPNELYNIFIKSGLKSDDILRMFNSYKKNEIIEQILILLRFNQFDEEIKEYYSIPTKYKNIDCDYLKKDIELDYEEMNNSIDKRVGETLSALWDYEEDKYLIGIHRTSNPPEEVFKEGIRMRGEWLDDNVQPMPNFCFMLRELKLCENYKFSRGCYIIKVPKSFVKGDVKNAEPIFYVKDNGDTYLRPEFISAYVPVLNERLGNVEMNDYPREYYNADDTKFKYNEDIDLENHKSYGFTNILLISVIIILITITIFLILK